MDYVILAITLVLPIIYGAALLTALARDVARHRQ